MDKIEALLATVQRHYAPVPTRYATTAGKRAIFQQDYPAKEAGEPKVQLGAGRRPVVAKEVHVVAMNVYLYSSSDGSRSPGPVSSYYGGRWWGTSSDSDIDITQGSFLNASTTLTIALSVAAGVLGVILVLVIMFIIWKL